jgi:hypothetical protein
VLSWLQAVLASPPVVLGARKSVSQRTAATAWGCRPLPRARSFMLTGTWGSASLHPRLYAFVRSAHSWQFTSLALRALPAIY